MKIHPAGHRVLIKLDVVEEKSEGGIIINSNPDSMKGEQQGVEAGTVVSLGPTAYKDFTGEAWCKVGDRVNFKRYEGVYKEVDDEHYRIVNDEDIFAIIEE